MQANSNLFSSFIAAQQLEANGEVEAAVERYESIVTQCVAPANSSKVSTTATTATAPPSTSRKRQRQSAQPPALLIASCSLTCIGGHYLDAEDIDEARGYFLRAHELWPENVLATVNLANIEREWGDEEAAIKLYREIIQVGVDAEREAQGSGFEAEEWELELVYGPRHTVNAMAHYLLALMLHQKGSFDEALTYLRCFPVRYRLAPTLWTTAYQLLKSGNVDDGETAREDIRLIQNAVNQTDVERLQEAFSPESPFWEGTDYHNRGYFSFHYAVDEAPSNIVEKLIKEHLLPKTGRKDIKVAEWWVHSRVCGRSLGHQLHFDTEEASLNNDRQIHHPALSSVLYVSVLPNADPTIILDQKVGEGPAKKGFIVPPAQGSFLLFPGDLLHGVLPSALPNPNRHQRITLMVGFWTRKISKLPELGPCGSLPAVTATCQWPNVLQEKSLEKSEDTELSTAACEECGEKENIPCKIVEVAAPWEQIEMDTTEKLLEVPEELDQRFYVKDMESFRAQLVERMLD